MLQIKYFGYIEGENFQAVELPYNGGELSMVVLLPRSGQFGEFESALTLAKMNEIINNIKSTRSTRVKLTLPKFRYESGSISLKNTLSGMGMPDAFSGAADFSGMDGSSNLFIGDILHKAFIAVDEEGTEAAGVTVVLILTGEPSKQPPKPVEFTVNRPFIFLIRDIKTGTILFLGRIVNPVG